MYELFIQGYFYSKNWKKFYFFEDINFKRQPLICFSGLLKVNYCLDSRDWLNEYEIKEALISMY